VAASALQRLLILAKAAEAISASDLVTTRLRANQQWSLAPLAALLGAAYPATYMRGPREALNMHDPPFGRFTAYLGSMSSQGRTKRLIGELHSRLSASSAGFRADRESLALEYLPALRASLTLPLLRASRATDVRGGDGDALSSAEAAAHVAADMLALNLQREDLDTIAEIGGFKTVDGKDTWNADIFKGVPAKDKAALTRHLTAGAASSKARTAIQAAEAKPSSRRGKGAAAKVANAATASKRKKPIKDEVEPLVHDGDLAEAAALGADGASSEDLDDEVDLNLLARHGITVEAKAKAAPRAKAKKG